MAGGNRTGIWRGADLEADTRAAAAGAATTAQSGEATRRTTGAQTGLAQAQTADTDVQELTAQLAAGEYSKVTTIFGTAAHTCLFSGKYTRRLNHGATGPLAGKTCLPSGKDT